MKMFCLFRFCSRCFVRLFEEVGVQSASVVIKEITKTSRLALSAAVTSDLGEAVPGKQQAWIVLGQRTQSLPLILSNPSLSLYATFSPSGMCRNVCRLI